MYQVIIIDKNNELVASQSNMSLEQAERYANDYNYSAKTTYAKVIGA